MIRCVLAVAALLFTPLTVVAALLFTSLTVALPAQALDREARLAEASAAYATALAEPDRDARLAGFARAQRGFASLVEDGVATAPLYVDLGNAALQAQDRGTAVLAYLRALRIDPDDRTARQNLAHVRGRLPTWVPRPDEAEGFAGFFDDRLLPRVWRGRGAAIAFLLAALAVVLSVRERPGSWRGVALLGFVVWAVLLGSTLVDAGGDRPLAVLVAAETEARSADSALAPRALPEPLPAGVEVDLLEEREGWARVRLANGRDVWVRRSHVARVDVFADSGPSTPVSG